MSLEKEDHTTVITMLCTKLQNIPLEELPPFVHQSLRLCSNQDNKHLLEALRRYFTLRFSQANSEDSDTFETIGKDIIQKTKSKKCSSTVFFIHYLSQLQYKRSDVSAFIFIF